MFIGLGGTGNEVVRRVKMEMLRHGYDLPLFQYLVLDTVPFNEDPDMNPLMRLRNGEEYLYIGGYNPNEILKRIDNWPVIAHWWGTRDQTNLVTVDEGAGQMRSVGRMGFFRHFTLIYTRLERMVRSVMSTSNREAALLKNYDVPASKPPVVYLVFSLCGGTGSSLFFDVAYVLRKLFDVKPTIVGLAMLAGPYVQEIQSLPQQERIQANTYAALQELERLHDIALGQAPRPNGKDIWDVQYATNFHVSSPDLPFDYIYLIDDRTEIGERNNREQIYGLMSQAIFWLSGPSTAVHFWERAKNLSSNTLAGGSRPDPAGGLHFSKYSSLGIGIVKLEWHLERVQQELEIIILDIIRKTPTSKPRLVNWLSNADTLINKITDEPGVNLVPGANELKPTGLLRDRAQLDELLEGYTIKYEAVLASLPRSGKWQRTKEKYKKEALDELNSLFRKGLIERGPVAALQEMEMIKESLDESLKKLDELEAKAKEQETQLREDYENTRRTLEPDSRFVQTMSSIVDSFRKVYGRKNTSAERNLKTLAANTSHQRYLWYLARLRIYLCVEAQKYIIEPALIHAEKLRSLLEDIDDELQTWQDRIQQSGSSLYGEEDLSNSESVIRIRPSISERNQITDAIKRGDIRSEMLTSKILKQAFQEWPKSDGNVLEALKAAITVSLPDILQRTVRKERLLDRLQGSGAWRQRELFLQRAECMWSFSKDATQEVLSHLEKINLLGYGNEDDSTNKQNNVQHQIDTLLKQQDIAPERVSTNVTDELMLMKTSHGLPISLIRSMPELHHSYQVMNIMRSAPYLHLDYRDQIQAGYGPLTSIEMTAQQIFDTWVDASEVLEHSMSDLAATIKNSALSYESKLHTTRFETIEVQNENDPLFDLIGEIEEATTKRNKTPIVSEALIKLSDLVGLLHAQGWVIIEPARGSHVDPERHKQVGVREETQILPDRISEVIRRGYIRQRPNQPPQIRKARVIISTSPGQQDISAHQTTLIVP